MNAIRPPRLAGRKRPRPSHGGLTFASVVVVLLLRACSPSADQLGFPDFVEGPGNASPLAPYGVAQPLELDQERNGMHQNVANNAVTNTPGPIGDGTKTYDVRYVDLAPIVISCPGIVFLSSDRFATTCFIIDLSNPLAGAIVKLRLVDVDTLRILDEVNLPRKANATPGGEAADASGGAYIHLLDSSVTASGTPEVIVGDYDAVIRTFAMTNDQLVETSSLDLRAIGGLTADDNLTDIVYDYDGNLWFTASSGVVGFVDGNNNTYSTNLGDLTAGPDDNLQNAVASDTTGVYMTLFNETAQNDFFKVRANNTNDGVEVVWQSPYSNAAGPQGLVGQGSGTTPTIFGESGEFVAITDNDTPQLHLNVYSAANGALLCQGDAFTPGAGAVENSPVAYGDSIAIVNNHNFPGFNELFPDISTMTRGFERFTVVADAGSPTGYSCQKDWTQPYRSPSVPQLSTATGMVYMGEVVKNSKGFGVMLTGADWETGERVFSKWVGAGSQYDPALVNMVIAPDGSVIQPSRNGIWKVTEN